MSKDNTPLTGKEKADKLNEEFQFASTKLKAGSQDIQIYLDPLLKTLAGDKGKIHQPGDGNQYYEISKSWDGDYRTLFQYVTFKDIPNDQRAENYIYQIENNEKTAKYMSPEDYSDYERQYKSKAYNTLTSRLGLAKADILEEIMNSSAMWRVATVSLYDSDQNKEKWVEIYHDMEEILDNDADLFAWVIQQIENEKHTAGWIINAIDDEFKLMMAGKYSHRLHKYYR